MEVKWLTGHPAKLKAFRMFHLKAALNLEQEGKTAHGEKNGAMREKARKNEKITDFSYWRFISIIF